MLFVSLMNAKHCSPVSFQRNSYEAPCNTSLVQMVPLDLVSVCGVHVTLLIFLVIQVDSGRCLFL